MKVNINFTDKLGKKYKIKINHLSYIIYRDAYYYMSGGIKAWEKSKSLQNLYSKEVIDFAEKYKKNMAFI